MYVAIPEAVPVPATPPSCADVEDVTSLFVKNAELGTIPPVAKTVYVSSKRISPVASTGVTVIVAFSPGT